MVTGLDVVEQHEAGDVPGAVAPPPASTRRVVSVASDANRRVGGLDGLRGVAAVAVVVFHAGVPLAGGWFLGVSLFFTLSGFLVARVLMAEQARRGAIDVRGFWVRRIRRLLPASLLVVALVAVVAPLTGRADARFPGDVVGAAFGLMNWRLVLTDRSYGALFGDTSPLVHYWSLGVEEQLYLVLGALLAWMGRRSTRRVTLMLLLIVAAAAFVWGAGRSSGDVTLLYYGTDVRLVEVFIGAAAGVALAGTNGDRVRWRAACGPLGPVALAVLSVLWATMNAGDPLLFRGALGLHALATVVLIVHVLDGHRLSRFAAARPLQWLGRLSYGIYLVHLPVVVVLRQTTSANAWVVLALTLMVTLPAAWLLQRHVEAPILEGRLLPGRRLAVAGCVVLPLVLLLGIAAPHWGPADSSARSVLASAPETPELVIGPNGDPPVTTGPPATTTPGAPPTTATRSAAGHRVLITGDSMSFVLHGGVDAEGATAGVISASVPAVGCGIGRPLRRDYLGTRMEPKGCKAWRSRLRSGIADFKPEVVVVFAGLADLSDARLPGVDGWHHIGEPVFDEWLLGEMQAMVELVAAAGPRIVWLSYPPVNPEYVPGSMGRPPYREAEPARVAALNVLIHRLVETHPEVTLAPFDEWIGSQPGGPYSPDLRNDGVHLNDRGARLAADWLMPIVASALAR